MNDTPHTANQRGLLNLETLRGEIETGAIDTVLMVMTDMQGRLQGKRLDAHHFLDEVVKHHAEGCNYTLATDVEMHTVDGYAMTSWDKGYGDFSYVPDLGTLRRIPWFERNALVTCDLAWDDGSPVAVSPRQILRRQLERLAEHGLEAYAGTELEFIVFRNTYEDAWHRRYHDLMPANLYNIDYSMLGTSRVEPLVGRIRRAMAGAGIAVQDSKGECNLGQQEINFVFDRALRIADEHAIYKNGAKEIAVQEGCALTFMAKFNEREGNSCHIHLSVRDRKGGLAMAGEGGDGTSPLFRQFLAGQLACLRELTMFFAPNINSYKRYAKGSFAPTAVAWGRDNRTCALRVVGHGASLRLENRVPGGDVNPYLALAAMIAAGLYGIEHKLDLEAPLAGNAYNSDKPHVPHTLNAARELLRNSEMARTAFGEDVIQHYLNMAQIEIDAFEAAVTDWERVRCFERL